VAARFWNLHAFGFNSDEAVYSAQGATIAGASELEPFFRIFRAHPLLFQTLLSLDWRAGLSESFDRFLTAGFGVATIIVTYKLGALLYGRRAGLFAAALLAVMPYHVVVSRQVLLDIPLTLFATASLYCLARFVLTSQPRWLYATSCFLGLAFLSKETAMLIYGAVYAFFILSPEVRLRLRHLVIAIGLAAALMAVMPLALLLSGSKSTAGHYLVWQLLRRPNHDWTFYFVEVPRALGPLLVLVVLAGLWLLRDERSWRERLLLSWIAVPFLFFELWPVKGFQYLLPLAPAVAVLAGKALTRWPERRHYRPWVAPTLAAVVVASLFVSSWERIQPVSRTRSLAGAGGIPGGREAGRWMAERTARDATFFAIGPSMTNIIQFYGLRRGFGLSVSPNPLARNPAYEPVRNPDLLLRRNKIAYLVWDTYSAHRSPFFSRKLLQYADRYDARVAHTETISVRGPSGAAVRRPAIVVYRVPRQPPPPGARAARAVPPDLLPAAVPRPRTRQRVVIYIAYFGALLLGGVVLALALTGERRARRAGVPLLRRLRFETVPAIQPAALDAGGAWWRSLAPSAAGTAGNGRGNRTRDDAEIHARLQTILQQLAPRERAREREATAVGAASAPERHDVR
jgi:hypothetical protein